MLWETRVNSKIHAYDSISDENIWAIITRHIPELRNEVNRLIDKHK